MPLVLKEYLPIQPIWLSIILYYFGLFHILKNLFSFLKWTYTTFLRPSKKLTTSYGSWALVTGSTDGIGKAFAFQLATQGLNLILISRNLDKLTLVSTEIRHRFPNINVKVMSLDFSRDISYIIKDIERVVKGLDVGILINNVGITYPKAMYFHEVSEEIWMEIVKVNIRVTIGVSKVILHGMLSRKKGAIVNIGSGASVIVPSHPLYAIYAATKAFIDEFSRSLHVEYKNRGIDVQCQVPLYVMTKMASSVASVQRSSMFVPTADEYAAAAVRRVGFEARCSPYWAHSLQWFATSFVPNTFLDAWRLSIGLQRRATLSNVF